MPTIGTIFDVYLNINILLVVATCLWAGTGFAMRLSGMTHAYAIKLRLLKTLIVTCFIAPVAILLMDTYVGKSGGTFSFSLSDLIVAQYLHGSFDVAAADLHEMLGMRTRLTEDLLNIQSPLALGVVGVALFGIAFGLMRLCTSIWRLHRILDRCYSFRTIGNLRLMISESVTTPFSTRGLFRRYIVFPSTMLENGNDLRIALGHELQHVRQRDTEWEIILEFLRPIFFWNPAFHLLKFQMEQLRELSCDQQVITRRGVSVEDYCQCLLRTCEDGLRRRELLGRTMPHVAFVHLDGSLIGSSSANFLRHRMLSLIKGNRTKYLSVKSAILALAMLTSMMIASFLLQKPNDWSHERIMFSTILNLDRLAQLNRN